MRVTMWVMLIVGLVEIVANLFFLVNMIRGKGLEVAKKFHGDFPPFVDNKIWVNKILVSIILGIFALVASFSIYKNHDSKVIISSLFAGSLLLLCIIQAILYGKKHIPAQISIILGVIFVILVLFHI